MKNDFPKIPLAFSTTFFLFAVIVFLFLSREIINNDKTAEDSEILWQTEFAKRNEMKSLDESVHVIEGEIISLEKHFARNSDPVSFLDSIETLASRVGVKADISSVDSQKDNTKLVVTLKASGSFEGIYKFITLLENFPYELEFLSIDMQKSLGEEEIKDKVVIRKWDASLRVRLLSILE